MKIKKETRLRKKEVDKLRMDNAYWTGLVIGMWLGWLVGVITIISLS